MKHSGYAVWRSVRVRWMTVRQRADDAADAKAIIEKGPSRHHGGRTSRQNCPAFSLKFKGTFPRDGRGRHPDERRNLVAGAGQAADRDSRGKPAARR